MNWLDLCRGRPCIACGRQESVIPAHSNQQAHGKGKGIKAGDWSVLPLCRTCHYRLDHDLEREAARAFWAQHWALHHMALCQAELIAPVGHKERERKVTRLAKTLPRNKPDWKPAA